MKKMLYILNIANRVNNFSYTSMKAAQELGYEYHIAGNWSYANDQERIADEKKYGIHIYQIDFIRTPYHPGNIKAYKQLKEIVEREQFDVIHCNTPIGGIVGRLVGKSCKVPKVIYQAHGFHFYKGAPIFNWLVYYPIERLLAKITDDLITINIEDYNRAKSFKLRNNGKVYYVPGVGIEISKTVYDEEKRKKKRAELGIPSDAFLIVSVGELNKNKNNVVVIDALRRINNNNIHYILCGNGPLKGQLEKISDLSNVHFLGYRSDVKELLSASDVFVLPSYREGLSRSLMEAMVAGLPCVVSSIRGNVDLISCDEMLCNPHSSFDFESAFRLLYSDVYLRERVSSINRNNITKFSIDCVIKELIDVYTDVLSF